jgi:hypothetical protein
MSYPSLRRRRGPTKEAQESVRRWSERLPQKGEGLQPTSEQEQKVIDEKKSIGDAPRLTT